MTKEEMANAYAEGFENEKYRQIAYDAFLCGFTAKCESSLPSNLDEAALQWCDSVKFYSDLSGTPINAFKAGAKWMAEQGESVMGIITKVGDKLDAETTEYLIPEESEFERGDRVVIQIRKMEE